MLNSRDGGSGIREILVDLQDGLTLLNTFVIILIGSCIFWGALPNKVR
jgi:hypothetical protein